MTILDPFCTRGSLAALFAVLLLARVAAAGVDITHGLSETTYPVVVSGSRVDGLLGTTMEIEISDPVTGAGP